MSQTILGIDIGSYSIKVAEIERRLRDWHLVGFFEQPIVFYENLGKEGSTSQALGRLFEEYNLSSSLIYSALPGQLTSNRLIDLPFSDFKKVDQTIEFEMENYVPLPLEELLIDYEFLTSAKTGSTVLVSYAKKSDFVSFLNTMNSADVDPRFVGSESVELSNIMKLGVLQPEGAYALVDIGHEKTNVVIFIGPKLQFTRTIMLGGRDLTKAIAESLSIPLEEAERMKIEIGQVGAETEDADATTRRVAQAMKAPLEELILGLRQTFMAFDDAKKEVVQALILCGGTSRLPGIDNYLSERLRKNVSHLDCLDFPFNQLAESNWCRPIAASALSLAYRGVLGSGVRDIQFRRGEFAHKGEIKEYISMAKQGAIILSLVALCAFGSTIVGYTTLKGRLKNQMTQVTNLATQALPDISKKSLGSATTIVSTLNGKISDTQEKKKKIEEETSLSVLDVMRDFSRSLPARDSVQIDVDDFTYAAHRVRLQAKTDSFEAVDQIKEALTQSKIFQNVATENVKKRTFRGKEEIQFSLTFEVVGGGATPPEGA